MQAAIASSLSPLPQPLHELRKLRGTVPSFPSVSYSLHPLRESDKAPELTSGNVFSGVLHALTNVTDVLYNRGEGVRYGIEQTFGYTIPRVWQQWNSTKEFTGEPNKRAAEEMFMRDSAADFTDTFLPGLLATLAIGKGLDAVGNGFVRYNIPWEHNEFYRHVLGNTTEKSEFFGKLEQALPKTKQPINLQQTVEALSEWHQRNPFVQRAKKAMGGHDPYLEKAQELATKLGQESLSVSLEHGDKAIETDLPLLLQDLTRLNLHAKEWGNQLVKTLGKTANLQPLQGLGTAVAFYISLNIPHWIREYTAWKYKTDVNPNKEEIQRAYNVQLSEKQKVAKDDKIKWFPYIRDQLKEGNIIPAALSAGFGAFVLGATAMTFRGHINGKNVWQLGKGVRDFLSFERGFPFTTVQQMTLTYGALCAVRLMESRDKQDFYSTLLRDNVLGYPTLTWGNGIIRDKLTHFANSHVGRQLTKEGLLSEEKVKEVGKKLLFKDAAGVERRDAADITEGIMKNVLKLSQEQEHLIPKITERLHKANSLVTMTTAVTLIALLAGIEPQLGIWLTNKITVDELENQDNHSGSATPPPLQPQGQRLQPTTVQPTVQGNLANPTLPNPWLGMKPAAAHPIGIQPRGLPQLATPPQLMSTTAPQKNYFSLETPQELPSVTGIVNNYVNYAY